jgi:hypothetical protein
MLAASLEKWTVTKSAPRLLSDHFRERVVVDHTLRRYRVDVERLNSEGELLLTQAMPSIGSGLDVE